MRPFLLFLALTALPASAGTLYKCTGPDGVPNYVSKRVSGASCEVISRYTPDRSRPAQVATVSRPATPPPAVGAAVTPALSDSAAAMVPAATPDVTPSGFRIRALDLAGAWAEAPENRPELTRILSAPEHVGVAALAQAVLVQLRQLQFVGGAYGLAVGVVGFALRGLLRCKAVHAVPLGWCLSHCWCFPCFLSVLWLPACK